MSECDKFQELISAALDDELNEAEKAQLAEHLKTCPDCARMYEAFTALSQAMDSELEEMPEELHENIMAEIRREDIKKKNRKLSKPLKTLIASAACAALVIAGAVLAAPDRSESAVLFSTAAVSEEENMETAQAPQSYEAAFPDTGFSENSAEIPMAAAEKEALPSGGASDAAAAEDAENTLRPSVGMFSSAPRKLQSFILNRQDWDSFRSLLAGSLIEEPGQDIPEMSFSVSLDSSPDTDFIELYAQGDRLIYMDSADGNFYNAGCSYEQAAHFLNIS